MLTKSERDKITKTIISQWHLNHEVYDNFGKELKSKFSLELYKIGIIPLVDYRVKELTSLIKKSLREEKKYIDPWNEINDKLGLRITCKFRSDLPKIKSLIQTIFHIKNTDDKSKGLKYNELNYLGIHYDVRIKIAYFEDWKNFKDFIFEVQLRTICQNTWADLAHDLVYKVERSIKSSTKRKIFRLQSFLEFCDIEFDSVNKMFQKSTSDRIISILNILEKKFYKIALTDYDKKLSISILSNLAQSYINDKKEFENLKLDLRDFLDNNENRFQSIYSNRINELKTNIFFTQPEILFIWYLLEKKYHILKIDWQNKYDIQDLCDIANWWGKPVEYVT